MELTLEQKKIVYSNCKINVATCAAGSGKAQPLDSKVLTDNGWVDFGTLKVGDYVLSLNNKTKVTGIYPQGIKDVYRVIFNDRTSTECCLDHLWSVKNYNARMRGKNFQTLSLKELIPNLKLGRGARKNYSIPTQNINFSIKKVPVDPYVLGLLLGDGSIGNNQISLSTGDISIANEFESLLPTCLKVRRVGKYDYRVTGIIKYVNPLIDDLRTLKLWGSKSGTKFIPDVYKYNSKEIRESILQGLLDTDGYCSQDSGKIEFYSISEQLAKDVCEIVRSLGGKCSVTTKKSGYRKDGIYIPCSLCYRVYISLPLNITPFRLKRKLNNYRVSQDRYLTRYIDKVEYIGKKECQCISVDDPSHLYITDNYIPTHNTTTLIARTIRLWNEFREPTLICTFSKKAADDIYRRLGGNYSDMVEVKTIHSLCYSIVRDNWEILGQIVGNQEWPHEPVLATRNEELSLIIELFPKTNPEVFFNKLDEFRKWPITPAAAIRMMKQGVYLGKYSIRDLENWAYFEDERISRGTITFDDMTNLANLLVPLPEVSTRLANKYSHVLIDEAQDTSESQWAILRPLVMGATTTLAVGDLNQSLYGFRSADGSVMCSLAKMNDAVNFSITEAFRSGSAITDLANLLAWNKDNKIKALERKGKTELKKFDTPEEEVLWVMGNIKAGSVILSRTNSYLEKFERKALELNIPYRGNGFYRSSHIKDLFMFVSQLKQDDLKPIITKAYIENNSYSKIEKEDFKLALDIITKQGKEYFAGLVEKSELLDNDGIVLMTGHGAKGLEWDDVYAVGVHPGNIPHRLSKDEREERNILYVIITRAKNNLYISAVKEFSHFIPSEYLETV